MRCHVTPLMFGRYWTYRNYLWSPKAGSNTQVWYPSGGDNRTQTCNSLCNWTILQVENVSWEDVRLILDQYRHIFLAANKVIFNVWSTCRWRYELFFWPVKTRCWAALQSPRRPEPVHWSRMKGTSLLWYGREVQTHTLHSPAVKKGIGRWQLDSRIR